MASRWVQDGAVALQLQEVGACLALLSAAPDPKQARRLFVALTLVRQAPDLKR